MKSIIRNFIFVLRRFKTATILNLLGLAIAFAAFMIILMQVEYDLGFDKFHKDSECIYRLEAGNDSRNLSAYVSRPFANAFGQSSPHIKAYAITNSWLKTLYFTIDKDSTKKGFEEPIYGAQESFSNVFTFDIVEGEENALDKPGHVLIPASIASKLFGEESPIGKRLVCSVATFIVGGVYKDFPSNSIIQNPIIYPIDKNENLNRWGNQNYEMYLKVDSPENIENIIENFKRTFDVSNLEERYRWIKDADFRLTPLSEIHFTTDLSYDTTPKASRQTLYVLLAIAIAIITIASINFINFNTGLAPMRIRSINTRKVVGASEKSIRLSLLLEAVLVNILAYIISLVLIFVASKTFISSLLDVEISISTHLHLVALTALIALMTGCLSGLYPSYYLTSFPPALVLKGSFGLSPKGRVLRNLLISVQFVVSFIMIISTSFMYLQNEFINNVSVGYDKDQLIVTNISNDIVGRMDAFKEQVKTFPGIEDVTFSEVLLSSNDDYMSWGRKYQGTGVWFQCLPVDYSFLKVMGIEVTEGRDFREGDDKTPLGKFIFNETARKLFNLELNTDVDGTEIVGFMPDVRHTTFRTAPTPMAFYVWGTENWGTKPSYAYIKVRAKSDMHSAIEHVRQSLKSIDAEFPYNIRFYDDVFNQVYEKERGLTLQVTVFSIMAILISIIGVFGLVVFENEYRRREISIRKVFGSSIVEVLSLLNKKYLIILSICFVIACPVSYYIISSWLDNFTDRTPIHIGVFVASWLVVTLITVSTVSWQSWRSATANPVDSLKSE
ncbi:MAG: FtsX-like permease family protein [Dysgonomonas sp.]|nr:FtsX-like permease family protein [Dysgonomonas sp.]